MGQHHQVTPLCEGVLDLLLLEAMSSPPGEIASGESGPMEVSGDQVGEGLNCDMTRE